MILGRFLWSCGNSKVDELSELGHGRCGEEVADGELGASTDLSFDEPVTTRYVLLWVTGLVPSDGGFSAEVAEVALTPSS